MNSFESLTANQSLAAANYAARGRVHRDLPDHLLAEMWVAAFRATVGAPGRADLRNIERDLSAEFKLRNIDPPHHEVLEDRERLIAQIADQLELMRTSLPRDFELIQARTRGAPFSVNSRAH
jgi:hypothetical protein